MTDYLSYTGYEAQNLEETQKMEYNLMSENACDGYQQSNTMEMPGSPMSEGSDWSISTATTDYNLSQPSSPMSSSDDDSSIKKPLKSSLKRAGTASRHRRVTWDPNVVFETRPLSGKRRRSQVDDGNDYLETEIMNGNYDAELKAPIPTKRAKLVEIEHRASQASAVSSLHFLPSISPPVFPEASRTVIPSFNFSSIISPSIPRSSSSHLTSASDLSPSLPSPIVRPSFVPFSISTSKRNLSTSHSTLRH